MGRNPFVNQVSFFHVMNDSGYYDRWIGRNPFVNQVSFFLKQALRNGPYAWPSQSLRKSGQFLS